VLNRLFIIIGTLAILVIAAAFVVPAVIPWGDYRDRLATIASGVIGAPVRVEGDVSFTLLPNPHLSFERVSAGPADAPVLSVERVEAELSLLDFLRDRYNITRLVLTAPSLRMAIDADGGFAGGVGLPDGQQGNLSITGATIVDGAVTVSDARTGSDYAATAITGDLSLDHLRGPLSFAGRASYGGGAYAVRFTTGERETDGSGPLSVVLRPDDGGFALSADGVLDLAEAPNFTGTLSWRQTPRREPDGSNAGQGDFVLSGNISATASRVLFDQYQVTPDENRGATRLQGAAEIILGAQPSFNAIVSGGVVALPPRDATAEQAVQPYELVRLLAELPLPASPGIPGTIGLDLAELNLRAFSLRSLRLDARAHAGGWTIDRLEGVLPGDSSLVVVGELDTSTGRPEFGGRVTLATQRLDALSTLWRGLADGNPLFGVPGRLEAQLNLVGQTLSVSNARLDLDGTVLPFSAQVGLGAIRDLRLTAHLGALDAADSTALASLLPDLTQDAAFPATFPHGRFDVTADSLYLAGLAGTDLVARGTWDGGVLVVDDLTAADLGGLRLDAELTAFGTLTRPELSGTATLAIASASAPALARINQTIGAAPAVASFIQRAMPADVRLVLDAPTGDGAQDLRLTGTANGNGVTVNAQLGAGILRALSGSFASRTELRAPDADTLDRQLGVSTGLFAPDVPATLVAQVEGNVANSLATTLLLSSGSDSLGFSGNIVVTDPDAYSGIGTVKATLGDASALASLAGADGLSLPSLTGTASVVFNGNSDIVLDNIVGHAGGAEFTGRLARTVGPGGTALSGSLSLPALDVADLAGTLVGGASLLAGERFWPTGPLSTGTTPRSATGKIAITSPSVSVGGRELGTELGLDLDWDKTGTRLRNAHLAIGDGSATLELTLCCSGPLSAKQVSGRFGLTSVDLDAVTSAAVGAALDGTLTASGQFDATGESLYALIAGMTGQGTFDVSDLVIDRFAPNAWTAASAMTDIIERQPEEVIGAIEDGLAAGPFTSDRLAGSFTVAGGVLRSANLPIEGNGGRLFGSGSIRLGDLTLDGDYDLTAKVAPGDPTPPNAPIVARLGGTLLAPEPRFDVTALVDAIMVEAYEAEVDRLERLQAEDEARQRAAAEEQARLDAEAARQAEAEAAARRAEEEAARRAEEEAARRAAEQVLAPLDLGLGN